MINLKQFLLNSNIEFGTYALVTYNGRTEPIWFSNMGTSFNQKGNNDNWFLESPCTLYKVCNINKPVCEFADEYIDGLLEEGTNEEEYINNYVIPMIVDNVLYEIENFQCSPYLPEYVDDIKLMSERECLLWMLENRQ